MRVRAARALGLSSLLAASVLVAQPASRKATNIPAILAFPAFFTGQPVIVRGDLHTSDGQSRLRDTSGDHSLRAVFRGGPPADGPVEVRATVWDVGRMTPDDPRLAGLDMEGLLRPAYGDRWPKPGEELMLNVSDIAPASPPPAPTIRSIVMEPARYADLRVTVTGQFRGRNLYGDLPEQPGASRWEFVLRSADAALWASGIRPRGRNFNLDVDARVDTGRWLEVTGTIRQRRGLVWIEATTVSPAKAVDEAPAEPAPREVGPPPEVLFSAPTQDETDVPGDTTVRIQFSRDLDAETIKDHVRVSYLEQQSVERGEPQPPPIEVVAAYGSANRVLELRFRQPLERFRTLKVELLDGVKGTDGAPMKPWTLTFVLGG